MTSPRETAPEVDEISPWLAGRVEPGPAGRQAAEFNALVDAAGTARAQETVEAIRIKRAERATAARPPLVPVSDHILHTASGKLRVRLYRPADARGACLMIHGGGWVYGSIEESDEAASTLASSARMTVATVDYRLAPEHPFPAAQDDCEAAALWFLDQARDVIDTDRLVISGSSAGAHLALLTLLRLRDRHGLGSAFRGAYLRGGLYDLSMTPSQRRWDRNIVLSEPMLRLLYDCVTPGLTPEQRRNPAISPLYADLGGLPSTLCTVGTADPLLDDTLFLATRLRAAGNDVELRVIPEGIHGFEGLDLRISELARMATSSFIDRILGA